MGLDKLLYARRAGRRNSITRSRVEMERAAGQILELAPKPVENYLHGSRLISIQRLMDESQLHQKGKEYGHIRFIPLCKHDARRDQPRDL
jgi:hypothetical protein